MSKGHAGHKISDGILSKKFENSALWRLKVRLQFSGWLQYFPNALLTVIFLTLSFIGVWSGVAPLLFFWVPFCLGTVLFANLLFDLVTVKWAMRPPEPLPKPRDGLDAFDLMRARRSCRSFQSRKLTDEHRKALLEAVEMYSRPEHLLGDSPIRFEYVDVPLTVWPVVGAHEFLVAIAPKTYDRMAVIDVGRSLQKVVVRATQMGLGTCWIGPGADQQSIAKRLGERFCPDEDHIICVCAIGYASWFKPLLIRVMHRVNSRRLPLSSLFFAGVDFQEPLAVASESFSVYERCYEVCQWAPSSFNSQTSRCTAVVEETAEGGKQLARFDFGAATHSRYYAPVAVGIWCANWELGCEALGLPGAFRILTPNERKVDNPPELPRYDVSWIVKSSG